MSYDRFVSLANALGASLDSKARTFSLNRGDCTFTASFRQHKNNIGLSVTCTTEPLPAMRLRRENSTDRAGKRIGLNRELETGDSVFDQNVYTESNADDKNVLRTLSSEGVRKGALFILERGGFQHIDLGKKGVVAEYSGSSNTSVFDQQQFDESLGALAMIAAGLPHFAEWETNTPWWTMGKFVMIGSIVALVGGLIFTAISAANYRPLDWSPWLWGWALGAVAWVFWIPICGRLVRGRSDSMRNFLISVILFVFGLPIIGGGAFVFANGFFDSSPPVPHVTRVTRQWTSRSKNSTNYHTEVQGWRPGDVGIHFGGSGFYHSKKQGSPVTVISKAGAFGYEWIESCY
jgi:hypothetical protein